MVVKEINKQTKVFKPIELNIKIESFEELCSLWHRLNASANTIKLDFDHEEGVEWFAERPTELWKVLDRAILERQ
jgi:hypothetical protein